MWGETEAALLSNEILVGLGKSGLWVCPRGLVACARSSEKLAADEKLSDFDDRAGYVKRGEEATEAGDLKTADSGKYEDLDS